MGIVKVSTNFNIELEFEIPAFHRRLIAWGIDLFIQIFYLIIAFKLYDSYLVKNGSSDAAENMPWVFRIILLPVIVYHIVSEISMNGQSIGKKLMGIRVVNENGGKASISQFLIRSLIRTSDYMMLIIIIYSSLFGIYAIWALLLSILLLLLDIILIATSKKGQRLGDILAHTILLRTNATESMSGTVFLDVADNYRPSFPQIMQLSDKDMNAIKSILDTARKTGDYNLAEMASEKIKGHLKIESAISPFEFLDILLKDYNYLSTK